MFFKHFSEDEADFIFDLMFDCLKKSSQCISSTDPESTRLGRDARIALKLIGETPHSGRASHAREASDGR